MNIQSKDIQKFVAQQDSAKDISPKLAKAVIEMLGGEVEFVHNLDKTKVSNEVLNVPAFKDINNTWGFYCDNKKDMLVFLSEHIKASNYTSVIQYVFNNLDGVDRVEFKKVQADAVCFLMHDPKRDTIDSSPLARMLVTAFVNLVCADVAVRVSQDYYQSVVSSGSESKVSHFLNGLDKNPKRVLSNIIARKLISNTGGASDFLLSYETLVTTGELNFISLFKETADMIAFFEKNKSEIVLFFKQTKFGRHHESGVMATHDNIKLTNPDLSIDDVAMAVGSINKTDGTADKQVVKVITAILNHLLSALFEDYANDVSESPKAA